jgi:mono/diheme cytochrome c family protein
MHNMRVAVLTFAIGISFIAHAQQGPKTSLRDVYAGRGLFRAYCTACHGLDAKGSGPAAESLRTPPADLTTLSERNAGKFPADRVRDAIYSRGSIPAHGTPDMPMWGDVFHHVELDQEQIDARVHNLVACIESLQATKKQ